MDEEERIASALEQIANAPDLTWLTAAAIFLSGLISYFVAKWSLNQEKSERSQRQSKQIELVKLMLSNEIDKRWRDEVRAHIKNVLNEETISSLDGAGKMRLSEKDFFVIQDISTSFQKFWFLEDPDLISNIVHAHLRIKDLIDYMDVCRDFTEDMEKSRNALVSNDPHLTPDNIRHELREYRDDAVQLYEELRLRIIRVDMRLKSIRSQIRKDV